MQCMKLQPLIHLGKRSLVISNVKLSNHNAEKGINHILLQLTFAEGAH